MAAGEGAPLSPLLGVRQQLSEPEQSQGCKLELLEKAIHLDSEAVPGLGGQDVAHTESPVPSKAIAGKLPLARKVHMDPRQSAFMKLPQLQVQLGDCQVWVGDHRDQPDQPEPQQQALDIPRALVSGSTVCSVGPRTTRGEQRSAFSKPTKSPTERWGCFPVIPGGAPGDSLGALSGLLTASDIPCWGGLSTCRLLGDVWNLGMLSRNSLLCGTFQGTPMLWLEHTQVRVPTPLAPTTTLSRALLPSPLSSPGLSTQNWCVKCSLAFRLTADLVFHMRSHHKREHTEADTLPRKRSKEALICQVCHEYFRERHHLSRHMTSHS
ncbi:zinc finger protein 488 [Perognathus longimembris pacificus]|uniref:zinc finger protein 488 n=1 Tax=Perognathus longimembris pacificus TaxID=214514 RepID=UPI002018CA56|nr:zinc finger protein 488 [Perognathus longimembris pacificus]